MGRGRETRFPAFWRNKGSGRRKPAAIAKKTQFEPLEPRILLSADLSTGGVAGAMSDGLDQFGSVLREFILADALLDTQLPLIVRSGGDNLLNDFQIAPTIRELLAVDADIDGDGIVQGADETDLYNAAFDTSGNNALEFSELLIGKFVGDINGFLGNPDDQNGDQAVDSADLVSFLNNTDRDLVRTYSSSDFQNRSYNLQLDSASDTSTDSQVSFDLDFTLTFTSELALDLGFAAEDMGVFFPDTTLMVDAAVSFALQFGVLTSGEDAENADFFLSMPEPLAIEVAPQDAGLDGEVNIGFLGTDVNGGSATLEANIDAEFKNPAGGSIVSYADLMSEPAATLFEADPRGVTFDGSDSATVRQGFFGDLLITIPSHGYLGGERVVYSNGGGQDIGGLSDGSAYYVLTTPGSDTVKLTLTPGGDPISFGGAADLGTGHEHRLVDSIFDVHLPVKIKTGLAGFEPGTASHDAIISLDTPTHNPFDIGAATDDYGEAILKNEGRDTRFDFTVALTDFLSGYEEQDFLNFTNMDASSAIGLFREFGRYLDGLADSEDFTSYGIPFAAADLGDVLDFGDMWTDGLLFDDLDGAVDAAPLGFTNQEFGEGGSGTGGEITAGNEPDILGSTDPMIISFVIEVGDSGPTVVSVVTTPGDDTSEKLAVDGLMTDLNSALGSFSLAVTAANDGNGHIKLSADNPGEDIRISPGIRRLIDDDNAPRFSTAQELAVKLGEILHPDLLAPDQLAAIGAAYNTVTADLTYNISLENTLPFLEAKADFNLPLGPLDNISSGSQVLLGGSAGLDMVLGINLLDGSPGEYLTDSTTLAELGVEVKTDPAVTGENDVRTVYGRLPEDATFDIIIGSNSYEVVVSHSDTDDNLVGDDLVADINAAFVTAGIAGITASSEGNRIKLYSNTDFSVAVANGDPAMNKLGFRADHLAEPDGSGYSLTTTKNVPRLVGTLTDDALFTLDIGSDGTDLFTVTVQAGQAEANKTVLDLVNDVNEALGSVSLVSGPVSDFVLTTEATFSVSVNGDPSVEVVILPEATDGSAAATGFNGDTDVDPDTDTITLAGHGFETGESVIYNSGGGTVVGGLEEGGTYFVFVVDDTTIKMAGTEQEAIAGKTIDLLDKGSNDAHALTETPNAGIEDLVQDINRVIAGTTLDGLIQAESYVWGEKSHIRFKSVDDSVGQFEFTVAGGDPAESALGLPNNRLCRNMGDRFEASSQGDRLVLTSLDGSVFTVVPASANELGLPTDPQLQRSNTDDLVVTLSDGTMHRVNLDGVQDIEGVIDRIHEETGGTFNPGTGHWDAGLVTVKINDPAEGTGLMLTEGNWSDGDPRIFLVETINGSHAGVQLGIIRADVTRDANEDGFVNNLDADGIIDGAPIKSPQLADRFFLANAAVRGEFDLLTPQTDEDGAPNDTDNDGDVWDGIDASATLGYVGVSLSGGGMLSGEALATLDNGGTRGIDSITNTRPIVNGLVDGGFGHLVLTVDTVPPLSAMVPGAVDPSDPRISLTVNDLGDPFHEEAFDVAVVTAADRIEVPGDQTSWFTKGSAITIETEPGITLPAEVLASGHGSGMTGITLRTAVLNEYVGRLSGNAAFSISIDGGGPVPVTLSRGYTDNNDSIFDLAADINTALDEAALGERIEASVEDDRLVLKAVDPLIAAFTLTALAGDPTVTEMGFDPSQPSVTGESTVSIEAPRGWSMKLTAVTAATPSHFSVTTPGLSDLNGLGDLLLFDDIDFDDILAGLKELSSFLADFGSFGDLGDSLLLVDSSVNELMDLAGRFDTAVDKAEKNPAETLQSLEAKLMEAFGFPADFTSTVFSDVSDGLHVTDSTSFILGGGRTDLIALGAKVLSGGFHTRVSDVTYVENTYTGSDDLTRTGDGSLTLGGNRTDEIAAGSKAVFDGGEARVETVSYDAGSNTTTVNLGGDSLPSDLPDVNISFTAVSVFDPILSVGLAELTVSNDFIDLSLDRVSDPARPVLRFNMGLATEFSDVLDAALPDINLLELIPDVNLADMGRRGEVGFSLDEHGLNVGPSGNIFTLDGDQGSLVGPGSKVLFAGSETRVTDVAYTSNSFNADDGLDRLDGQRFTVSGDRTGDIAVGSKATFAGGDVRIANVDYDAGTGLTTVIVTDPVLPEGLPEVTVSFTTVTVADSVLPEGLSDLKVAFMLTAADHGLSWDSGTGFTLSEDQRGLIADGYRLFFEDGAQTRDTRVESVEYDIGTDTTTVTVSEDAALPADLSEVAISDEFAVLRAPGVLEAGGGMVLNLDFGIDLDDPGVGDDAGKVYLYGDTAIKGSLSTPFNGIDHEIRGMKFRAGLGPFSLEISDGSASVDVAFGVDTAFSGRKSVGDVDMSEGSSDVLSSLNQATTAEFPAGFNSMDIGAFTLGSPADMSMSASNSSKGASDSPAVGFEPVNGGFRSSFVDEYTGEKTNMFDNILLTVDGIDLFLSGLQDLLDGEVFGFQLPLIGDQLADGARFIEDLRDDFVDPFRGVIETADDVVTDFEDPDKNIVSGFIVNLLGPTGLNLLQPLKGVTDPQTVGDYIALDSDFSSIPESFMQWNMTIGGTLWNPSANIGFDLGLPGLNLQTEGRIDLKVSWELAFGFGINFTDGFYLDISDGDELELNVEVTLPDAALVGTLGFLRFKAEDKDVDGDGDSTHLSAKFGINIINRADRELIAHKDDLPPGEEINDYLDPKLTLPELFGGLSLDFVLGFEAAAELGMTLEVSGDLIGEDTAAGFPSISADLIADFGLDISLTELMGKDKDGGKDKSKDKSQEENAFVKTIKDGLKLVEFQHVSLDLGSYVSDVLGPVVDKIQDVTEPIQPIIDVITEPIPVISDLGPDLTLLDIAAMAGRVDKRLLYAIADVITLINAIPDPASAESLVLDFGNFTIYDKATMEQAKLWSDKFDIGKNTDSLLNDPKAITNLFSDFDSAMNNNTPKGNGKKTKGILNKMRSAGDFAFPIFDDPSQVFGLLTGRPAVLITYDMKPLSFEFEWSQFFSLYGPLGISINMEFSANIDFAFGYDTLGIQEFVESDFRDPLLLVDGFYISDTDLATGDFGTDVPELVFSGGLWAAAELNLGIARAGVGGGIFARVEFDLFDPDQDGRVRIKEILGNVENEWNYGIPALAPLAIFDVHGKMWARLFAFLEIDFVVFSFDIEFDITPPLTLLEFDIPFTRAPNLATETGGDLVINAGENAGERLNYNTADGSEMFTLWGGPNSLEVNVNSFGFTQQYDLGGSTIFASGGEGDDIFNLWGLKNPGITVQIDGGAGNDRIYLTNPSDPGDFFPGTAIITGGDGDDIIYGGGAIAGLESRGRDEIYGGLGADTIYAGGGDDLVFGDNGFKSRTSVRAFSGPTDGDDVVFGGSGNDILIGGGGSDTIDGGDDEDIIIGDGGQVTFNVTEPFEDEQVPNRSEVDKIKYTVRDFFFAGDVLRGGGGADEIYGGKGDDTIEGGPGGDLLLGENGLDSIRGGGGWDTIFGDNWRTTDTRLAGRIDPGDVQPTSGGEADEVYGDAGEDTIYGGGGGDLIHGGDDGDTIHGGTGGDELYGDSGNDAIYGEGDPDRIFGGTGDDTRLDGGEGDDEVRGGRGEDRLYAGLGSDLLFGEQGSDRYILNLRGADNSSINEVFDSGTSSGDTDSMVVNGTDIDDQFLLRAGYGKSFVALLNDFPNEGVYDNVERINYDGLERLVVNGLAGQDHFAVDDVAAEATINGGIGADFFQVGQMYRSPRAENPESNIAEDDQFGTIETTRGWLSSGITSPMTINGGAGEDEFVVFHNLAVLTLNGGTGDDLFTIRAFALVGSQDTPRERTDIHGGGGADLIQYAVNAPVNIDGGDGLDTVIVIGTEFADDFVVTEDGVFGAGLNVNFVGIEILRVDAAEGDDRFFVLSTGENFMTEIFGGLGSDTFNMAGDTPPVVSNDLLGHSGVITHSVENIGSEYDGIKVNGISANIADNDEPAIRITQTEGSTIVSEDGLTDSYMVVLTRKPDQDVYVKALAPVRTPEEEAMEAFHFSVSADEGDNATDGSSTTLRFTEDNWYLPQTVTVSVPDTTVVGPEDVVEATADTLRAAEHTFDGMNLSGMMVRIVSGTGVGQTRIIDSNTGSVLSLTREWDVVPIQTGDFPPAFEIVKPFNDEAAEGVRFGAVNHTVISRETLVGSETDGGPQDVFLAGDKTLTAGIRILEDEAVLGVSPDKLTARAGAFDGLDLSAARVWITTGPGADQVRDIAAVNGDTLTLASHWDSGDMPTHESVFTVLQHNGVFGQDLAGAVVRITEGPGRGQTRLIDDANSTADTLVLFNGWNSGNAPDVGSRFVVVRDDGIRSLVSENVPDTFQDFRARFPVAVGGLVGATVTITGGAGAGEWRTIAANTVDTITVDSPWAAELDATSTYEVTRGGEIVMVNDLPVTGNVTSIVTKSFSVTGASFPETDLSNELNGLRAAVIEVVGGTGIGQVRVVESSTADSITVTTPWRTELDDTSEFVINRFDGLALPSVKVRVEDNDAAGVVITRTGDTTAVVEGAAGNTSGAMDTYTVSLTRMPEADASVTLTPDPQIDLGAGPGLPLILDFKAPTETDPGDWDTPRIVSVAAVDDDIPEGFHHGYITHSVLSADVDFVLETMDRFPGLADEPQTSVMLMHKPVDAPIVVIVDGVVRDPARYELSSSTVIFLDEDGAPEEVKGEAAVHYSYVVPGYDGVEVDRVVADIGDNDTPGVLIMESDGSTDLIEVTDPADGAAQTLDGAPWDDTYSVVLTKEPVGEVWVTVRPEITRTTREKIRYDDVQVIVEADPVTSPDADSGTLVETFDGVDITIPYIMLRFDSTNWNAPQTVHVTAIDDFVADGGDTKVFAPKLHTVNDIMGPLFLQGAGGQGSRMGLTPPVLLPADPFNPDSLPETNIKQSTGEIAVPVSGDVTELTVFTKDVAEYDSLIDRTVEITAVGDGGPESVVGQFRLILKALDNGDQTTTLTLNDPWDVDAWQLKYLSEYAITNQSLNFFVDEDVQVDFLTVYHDDSVADNIGSLMDADEADLVRGYQQRITGLGMGPDMEIGGVTRPGGITFGGMETAVINLGSGKDTFTVESTHNRDDFTTWTMLNTGEGDDRVIVSLKADVTVAEGIAGGAAGNTLTSPGLIDLLGGVPPVGYAVMVTTGAGAGQIRAITAYDFATDTMTVNRDWTITPEAGSGFEIVDRGDGAFSLDTQGGDDTVVASASTLPLVIFGGKGNDTIIGGRGSDIIFGDSGRVDFLDESGGAVKVVTRLGSAPENITGGVLTAGDISLVVDENDLSVDQLPTEDGGLRGLVVWINEGKGAGQSRLIVSNTDNVITVDTPWSVVPDGTSGFRVTGLPSDQTDEMIRDAGFLFTSDPGVGGNDIIWGGMDEDVLMGGAGGDAMDGGGNADLIFGDSVKLDRTGGRADDFTSPRFRAHTGSIIYGLDALDRVDDSADYQDPAGFPSWANWDINMGEDARFGQIGDDFIAGGAGGDIVFGQMGDDTVQGDGAIVPTADAVQGASFAIPGFHLDGLPLVLDIFESVTDGDDYIEGNGGGDTIYGGLGQDDLIGGSSDLFSLATPELRPDGSDLIFGGVGTDILRNDTGDLSSDGHASDSDMILGDNGDIFRLVDPVTGGLLTFNYDNFGTGKLIPRAARLLDYSPGGSDYLPNAGAVNDIGAADEVHGESGDDFIYGMKGNDILFGEGQDDDIVGGYGNDWISGGTGQDGILGDDGRIYTSRNGLSEPLFGTDAIPPDQLDSYIATGGDIQNSYINLTGRLKKAANLTPFKLGDPAEPQYTPTYDPQLADDIIYGGWGSDFIHGGDGDDAISGAEALDAFYNAPSNSGNALAYDPGTGEFAAYNENDPWRKIDGFLLNFEAQEGLLDITYDPAGTLSDGDDVVFGDLGNDWIVGGTGKDHLYGGRGDDLLNADDDHDSTLGSGDDLANDVPDTDATYEDIAYGGAGRDVLIANTGGDRLIDWAGEFNSYVVPFSRFGVASVSRSLQPAIMDYLYDLSESDGADPTRVDDVPGSDPARNGEPYGELGLVNQHDPDWHDQTGGPADPQPGNHHGKVDVSRTAASDPSAPHTVLIFDELTGTWIPQE